MERRGMRPACVRAELSTLKAEAVIQREGAAA